MRPILLLLAFALSCACRADPALPITKGMTLSAMDARLIAEGWKPVRTPLDLFSGNPATIYRAGFHAVQMCSGTGRNPCVFNYAKNKKCLKIVTIGEYDPPENEPFVDNWTFACPGKN